MNESPGALPPTKRFSDRVDFYERYRPGYPSAIIPFLQESIGLVDTSIVVDIGSGTGLLTELFLQAGNDVYAVEPNDEMRAAADVRFSDLSNFHSINATAEHTSLADQSVDLVTAGQAFHWFELVATRREFQRILRPNGWIALVYNSWNVPGSTVAREYAELVNRYGTDYQRVKRQNLLGDDIVRFFGGEGPREEPFENNQRYDFDALRGRALSSSYAPLPGHANHEPFLNGLLELFERNAKDGRLEFPYVTTVFWGRLESPYRTQR